MNSVRHIIGYGCVLKFAHAYLFNNKLNWTHFLFIHSNTTIYLIHVKCTIQITTHAMVVSVDTFTDENVVWSSSFGW